MKWTWRLRELYPSSNLAPDDSNCGLFRLQILASVPLYLNKLLQIGVLPVILHEGIKLGNPFEDSGCKA